MFGRALLLLFMINLPLSGGWFWEAPFEMIKAVVVSAADAVLDVVDLGTDLFGVPPIQVRNHTKWECGPDDPKILDIPSHVATWASVMLFCRFWKDDINKCCIQHDKCCRSEKPPPCDYPFYRCLLRVANKFSLCLAPVVTFIEVMKAFGHGDPEPNSTTTTTTTVATTTTKKKQATKPGFICEVGGNWDGIGGKVMECPDDEHYCFSITCRKGPFGFDKYGCTGDGEDKTAQCHKIRGDRYPDLPCDCFIGAKDANLSNSYFHAPHTKDIHLPPLNKKKSAAVVAERDSQSKLDKQ
ncbi:hypothetical protein GPALN_004031 [Globodera pallida]|nr:hypothetical protein GPALN_004031 [Globodera pallida]